MHRETVILLTLIAYTVAMVLVGVLGRRVAGESGFLIGGRTLGPIVAGLSASATSSSAWTLLGVSGFAFANGLSAAWIFPSCVGGFALNWFLLAPRLRRRAAAENALTLADVLAGPPGSPGRVAVRRACALVILPSMAMYVASQFQGAGKAFGTMFGLDATSAVVLGAVVVLGYVLVGGFASIARANTLQGVAMLLAASILPIVGLVSVGGPSALAERIAADPEVPDGLFGGRTGAVALGFVLGLFGIGLGYPGQPHVIGFFLALRDERSVARARLCAMTWACIVYAGMLTVGWCGRVLLPELADRETVFVGLATHLLHPVVAGLMTAAILSAILSTVDSQLLTAASAVTHDLLGGRGPIVMRVALVATAAVAVVASLVGTQRIFVWVLAAWSAMGAAFGPLLLWTVWRGRPPWPTALAAIATDFALSTGAYVVESTRNSVFDRVVPFVAAFVVLLVSAAVQTRRRK